ncbi:MAG: DDE-type integrase/transposase/recombinase [Clostridium sp.]
MQSKEIQSWQDQSALTRYSLITPLLDQSLDSAAKTKLRGEISDRTGISTRTIYRYERTFLTDGFQGLRPQTKTQNTSKRLPDNFPELLEQAIQLKKEVPKRSVAQIIWILELEGRVAPGILKRSTMERHLYHAGFGIRQMQMYRDARDSSSKRFCKPHRMMLVQGDIKYGCKLPIGKKGALVQTYLSSAIDDHSRMILASEFYDNQEELIVEDTFRKVILLQGKFDACYFDNGSQYVARQLKLSLGKLGIPIRYARPRSGKSKGKIEKFHQVVDSFLREVKLQKVHTLEELNRYWRVYLEEAYQNYRHDGIAEYYESLNAPVPPEGISPVQEWNRDTRNLTYLDTSVVTEAFLHHESRCVDKGACISFRGRRYEIKPSLIGFKVEIAYDPKNPEILTVHHKGVEPFTARPVKIGSYCDKNPTLPISVQPELPESSRFLNALERKHEQSRKQVANAISFSTYGREGKANV